MLVNTSLKRATRTNIAPGWSSVERVVCPNDRVDKRVKTRQRGPDHVIACSRVPGFQMPGKGNEDEHETEGGEDWEERVKVAGHVSLEWWRGPRERGEMSSISWLLVFSLAMAIRTGILEKSIVSPNLGHKSRRHTLSQKTKFVTLSHTSPVTYSSSSMETIDVL